MIVKPINARNSKVYHNNNKCTERNNIEKYNILQGTGDKELCKRCEKLNQLI